MAQFFEAVKRRVGGEMKDFLGNLNADLMGDESTALARSTLAAGTTGGGRGGGGAVLGAAGMRSLGRGNADFLLDDAEGAMEEGYRAALVRFQLDQIKVGKEYQQLLQEKDAELTRLRQLYEADTGKQAPPCEETTAARRKGGALIGREEGEDPLRAYQGLTADQLRAQVEVLLDSVASWEQRVTELVGSKADLAAEVEQMKMRVESTQLKMGDLLDRVKLQQTELERYIGLAEEYRSRCKADGETIEGLLKDYTMLVSESQLTEQRLGRRVEELEHKRDELKTKLKAYERNILQLIDTQAELSATATATATAGPTGAAAAAVAALQKQLQQKEEEIKRLMQASSSTPAKAAEPVAADPEMAGKLRAAEGEVERLQRELDGARKSLEQALKLAERVQKENAALQTRRGEEEHAEAALREEVTELQAKLEAAYLSGRQELALAQDKIVKLETQVAAAAAAGKAAALEEARAALQPAVEQLRREKAEALELYAQENRRRKIVHNKLLEMQGNIRVLCRVRPVLPVELAADGGQGRDVTEIPTPEDIFVTKDDRSRARFEFDRVFSPGSTQEEVYAAVQPLVVSFMDGYNACIFAYGQTGAGKTWTMEGSPDDRGVNYRTLAEVFRLREERADSMRYTVHMSMLEVYCETVQDLLGQRDSKEGSLPKLEIRMLAEGKFDVPGLTLMGVSSMEEVVKHMTLGKQNRAVGAHDMNEHSSRSHSILSLRVRGESLHDKSSVVVSKLHLVDLAGSERLSKTDAQGERLKEAHAINKSLSALGDVIQALAAKSAKGNGGSGAGGHVPYRNSKLTFLLQDSLGGNSKLMMFCNISPAAYNSGETICSLNFAGRCRNVQLGQAKKGGGGGGGEEAARLREQLQQLQKELAAAKAGGGGSGGIATPRGKATGSSLRASGGVGRTPPTSR